MGMTPRGGQHVMTRDEEELGTVKEVLGDAFKVDAPWQRDYWLSIGSVLSIEEDEIVMDFDGEMLESYQLEDPEAGVTSESPILDAASETFATPEERELRRERNIYPEDS